MITYKTHESLKNIYLGLCYAEDASSYNICFSYILPSEDVVDLLVKKLFLLVEKKPYLRQTFSLKDESLIASIHSHLPPLVDKITAYFSDLNRLKKELCEKKHNFSQESGVVLTIINFLDKKEKVVFFNISHLIMDGVTLDYFIQDLNKIRLTKKKSIDESKLYIQSISDELFNINLNNVNLDNKPSLKILEEINGVDLLYADPESSHYELKLNSSLILSRIEEFKEKYCISMFNLFMIVYGVFLCKFFNKDRSLIYYPVNLRNEKKIDGCFINNAIFLTNEDDNKKCFISLINGFLLNFDKIKSSSRDSCPNVNSGLIFSFAYSNVVNVKPLKLRGKAYSAENYINLANSAISLKFCQRNKRIIFSFDVKKGFLSKKLSSNFIERFFNFLKAVLIHPYQSFSDFNLLFPSESKKILNFSKKRYAAYPKNKRIEKIFDYYACLKPQSIAILHEGKPITYEELHKITDDISFRLRKNFGISRNERVALCLSRKLDLVFYMIAVLKNRCAYIIIDSKSIIDKTFLILKSSSAQFLVTEESILKKIAFLQKKLDINIINIDYLSSFKVKESVVNYFKDDGFDKNLAQIVYTSGTTGEPKGVLISHKNIISLVKNSGIVDVDYSDTFSFFSDPTFDASTFEIWYPLLNGAKLFIPSDRDNFLSSVYDFRKILAKNKISVLWLTKSLFDQIYSLDKKIFNKLNYILVGGESLNKSLIQELSDSKFSPKKVINGYGPTENTTFSCFYVVNPSELNHFSTVPIGRPLNNRGAIVLDKDMNVLPFGISGELYLCGDGLSLGYVKNRELTDSRFLYVDLPIGRNKKELYYKTGDLAILLEDGNIECLGRNDFQVKIRGYRIELSEIENKLILHEKIKEVSVLTNRHFHPKSEKNYLIAYYVSDANLDLATYLNGCLPEYMNPKLYIHLSSIPKKNNGKINIGLLPDPELYFKKEYEAPSTKKQEIVCQAFSFVLNLDKISINDDFFYIGGDSIKAIGLTTILQNHFNISISDVFNKKTPKKIAELVSFSGENLTRELSLLKKSFLIKIKLEEDLLNERKNYFCSFKNFYFSKKLKVINNVLLTGATGYLGCNLLLKLLRNTNYHIFALVRESDKETASSRLEEKFLFYFNEDLSLFYNSRLTVISSDLSKNKMGLNDEDYLFLSKKIDSVIHAAALTKHYGNYDAFYDSNVRSTINLLDFCTLTKKKDFHHISTISVLHNSTKKKSFLNENDFSKNVTKNSNFYIKTKNEAEKIVLKYKKIGVNSNIYRLGNLAFIFDSGLAQKNADDNAFYNRIKSFVQLKFIVENMSLEEISPVNLSADAIVRIFDKNISQNVYHIVNDNLFDLKIFFSCFKQFGVVEVSLDVFLKKVFEKFYSSGYNQSCFYNFILALGLLPGEHKTFMNKMVLADKTNFILKKLDFFWPKICNEIFYKYLTVNKLVKNEGEVESDLSPFRYLEETVELI